MIMEISVAVIALAFAALAIYLIVFFKAMRKTLVQVNHTLIEVRKHLEEVGGQASKVLQHTNQVSYDLKRKMESLDPIFNAFSNVGDYLEEKTFFLKKSVLPSSHCHDDEEESTETSEAEDSSASSIRADVFDFINTSLNLWRKIKKRSRQ